MILRAERNRAFSEWATIHSGATVVLPSAVLAQPLASVATLRCTFGKLSGLPERSQRPRE